MWIDNTMTIDGGYQRSHYRSPHVGHDDHKGQTVRALLEGPFCEKRREDVAHHLDAICWMTQCFLLMKKKRLRHNPKQTIDNIG